VSRFGHLIHALEIEDTRPRARLTGEEFPADFRSDFTSDEMPPALLGNGNHLRFPDFDPHGSILYCYWEERDEWIECI
jgi:hypothetical protein